MTTDGERMERLLGHFATTRWGISPEAEMHPLTQMKLIEERHGKGNARKGLKMAINDIVEECADYDGTMTSALDAELERVDAMTLSEARAQFSRKLRAILKRGAICDEVEFYLMKNSEPFLEGDNASASQRMLDEFENLMGGAQK